LEANPDSCPAITGSEKAGCLPAPAFRANSIKKREVIREGDQMAQAAALKPKRFAETAKASPFEAFRQRFQQKLTPEGRKAIQLLARWGLPEISVVQLIFEYVTERTTTKRDDFQESADEISKAIYKLVEKLRRFHGSPGFRSFIEPMQIPHRPARIGADLREIAQAIDHLPDTLLMYAGTLDAVSRPRRAYPRNVFQSRMLYLLFIALKHADPTATNYRSYKRIQALMDDCGLFEDHKTFENRIRRFSGEHSEEALRADAVVERYGTFGIQRLFAFSHKGFHVISVN
jgi:hypothetical protein